MKDRVWQHRRWAAAGVAVLVAGAVMLIWVVRLLRSDVYAGVPSLSEIVNSVASVATPEITDGVEVSQSIVGSDNDLGEVRVYLNFTNPGNRSNALPLVLTVQDAGGAVVRTSRADPATIINHDYHRFVFETIPDSRAKMYTLTLTSPGTSPGDGLNAWLGNCDCYEDGVVSINGVSHPDQELMMRAFYRHSDVVVWKEVINRISQYKPEMVKGAGVVLVGVLGSIFALASLGATVVLPGQPEGVRGRPVWVALSLAVAVIVVVVTGAYEGVRGGG